MTPNQTLRRAAAVLAAAMLLTLLAACTPAATPAPTSAPAPTDAPATATPLPPTAEPTIEPSATEVPPTATPAATATPEIVATQVSGEVVAWCLPKDHAVLTQADRDPAQIPADVAPGTLENGAYSLITPAQVCNMAFTLNNPVAPETILQVLDAYNNIWLEIKLVASTTNPNVGVAVITHSYIVEPPFWEIVYPVRLLAPDGSEFWSGKINARRGWKPEPCWDGTLPNVSTLYCPKQQDLHPWDPAYTPVAPTPTS